MTASESFKECVAITNGIIQRWLTVNGVNPSKIYTDDVRGILLGYMSRLIFKNDHKVDFKRFSRCIIVIINERTKMISHVLCSVNEDIYFRDKGFVRNIVEIMNKTEYVSILPKEPENSNSQYLKEHYYGDDKPVNNIELPHLNTNVDINFNSIESIKF